MSVYKPQKSPFWHYDFVLPGGKRCYGSTGQRTKAAARKVEDRRRREAASEPERQRATLEDAFEAYWSNIAKEQPSARTTRGQTRNILARLGARTEVASVTQSDIAGYTLQRRNEVSAATTNREVQLMRRVWRYCDEVLDSDIGKMPRWGSLILPEPKERVRELGRDEQERLFKILREDLKPPVMFSLLCGARLSSVIRLEWSGVRDNEGTVTFPAKGGGVHTVPLTTRLRECIRAAPQVHERVFTYVCQKSRGDRRRGNRYPLTETALGKPWRGALRAAGITDLRFHDTRHTAATRALRASRNLKAVQRLLGHASITTTSRYAHAMLDDVREAMELAERADEVAVARPLSPQ